MKQKDTQISQTAILEASTQFCDMIHSGSLTLFGNVSTVCCDSPSLSSAPNSKVPRRLLGASLYEIDIYLLTYLLRAMTCRCQLNTFIRQKVTERLKTNETK